MEFFSKPIKKKDKEKRQTPELNTNKHKDESKVKTQATPVSPKQKNTITSKNKPKATTPKVKAESTKPTTKTGPANPTKKNAPAKSTAKTEPTKLKAEKTSKKVDAPLPTPETPKTTARPETSKSSNTGFFEIKKSKDDRYVFNLFASNRVIVATSQVYSSTQSALNGINSVIANAASAKIEDQTVKDFVPQNYPKWEIYKDKSGDFRFRLSASNGSCICHSQGYTSKTNCKKGIESIIKNTKTAKIEKTYLKKQ